jgi:hypothetical protein
MQRYMREILSLAYGTHPPYHREVIDGVEHVFPRQNVRDDPSQDERFDHVISEWNSSMHQLLVTAPAEIVMLSRRIDTELDRLLDLAIDEQWSREAFRAERVEVGELVAQFVNVARSATGADKLDVENVWTWADPPTFHHGRAEGSPRSG